MVNEATFSVTGYVATEPKGGWTRDGTRTLFMRLGWTPRRMDRTTGEWADQPTSFISVICYRKVAENAAMCLRRGDPVVVKGNLHVREYGDEKAKRTTVEVIADAIGHDLSRGVSFFKKSTEQLEKTAAEREREKAGARQPLPGDRDPVSETGDPLRDRGALSEDREAGEPADVQSDADYSAQDAAGYRPDLGADYPAELEHDGHEPEGGEEFDDEEARRIIAHAGQAAEPVGAAT